MGEAVGRGGGAVAHSGNSGVWLNRGLIGLRGGRLCIYVKHILHDV